MFYYLRGTLAVLRQGFAVLDCGGVGFQLAISASTFASLSASLGKETTLYTYLSVRENAMELCGFSSEEELDLFEKLIDVSGVGPKAALSILGVLTPAELIRACADGDYKAVTRAPGVGSKTAQRVVLELKGSLPDLSWGASEAHGSSVESSRNTLSQITDTLVLYGFSREEIQDATRGMDFDRPIEELIADTLRVLASKR